MKINPSHHHNALSKTSQSRNYYLSQGLKRPLKSKENQLRGKGTRNVLLHLSQLSLYLCSDILAECLVDIQWLTSCLLHDVT